MTVKVCGMREPQNIRAVEALGVDMMGFIFAPKSPRYVSAKPDYLPQCHRVGVFVDATLETIKNKATDFCLDYIQLHGHETPQFCQQVRQATGLKIIKATTPSLGNDYQCADLLIFDTPGGGTGQKFDWSQLNDYHGTIPFLLAGGIGPDDAEAIRQITHTQFAGVDLNSRFEISPALKEITRLQHFLVNLEKPRNT